MLEQDRSVQSGAVTTVAAPQATDAYLATIVRVSSEAIIGAAGDGTIQSWNPAAERIFGYTAAEAVGRSIAFLAPLGHEAEQQAIIARLRAGQAASVETVRRAKDGRAVHVLLNAAPVLDVAGQLVLIATTLTDITPRKRAEAALRASADRLRRIIDVESVGIIFFHVDGRITGSNRAFLRMSGYSQVDLDHGLVRWDSMTPPEYMPQSRQAVAEFRAHGRISPYEKEYIRKDGSRWWGVFAAMRLDDDQGAEFIIDITERKRAEEALRDSEERFRQLAEALDECVWVFCTDTRRLIYVSPAYETIWGRSRHALAADAIWPDALHPDDREHVLGRLAACVACDGDYNAEYRIIRSDGTIRWIAERAFPIRNARGETYRLAGISSDITAQKQAEQEIQRLNADLEQRVVERTAELAAANRDLKHEIAERQRVEAAARAEYAFRTAIEAANVSGVVAADLTGRTFYVNPAFCRLVGWREDELLGELPPYRYWPDEEITHLRHALEQALTGKAPPGGLEVRFRRCTGERFDALVLVAPLQDEHGQQIGSIGSIYDITERKRAEAARHASERKYRLLLEQAADGIFVAAPDGTYIEVNTEGCRMLGYTREEILRLNIRDLVLAEDQAQTPIRWDVLESGATVTSERRLQRKDGSFLVAEINAKRLDNGDLQGIVRDITARKQAEARLQESERRLAE